MITTWWAACAPREKWLVGIAGMLTVLVVLGFGILAPLNAAKKDARLRFDQMSKDYVLVERAVQRLAASGSALRGGGPATDNDSFRSQVTQMAQQSGLAIARIQANEDGGVQLVFSDVSPSLMYGWLEQVSRLPGGATYSANVTRREDTIQAIVELRGSRQ